jgi:lysophospholipase L1-like esterase
MRLIKHLGLGLFAAGLAGFAQSTNNEAALAELLNTPTVLSRALMSDGKPARLQHVMAKARRGETITFAVIGGSITQGAKASRPELRYGNLIADWWRQNFPKAKIEFVNAGIGATGSNYGALRAKRDLLSHQPDCVVVEYAVNDGPLEVCAQTLEGLTRQILAQPNQPAVLLVLMLHRHGGSAQDWHAKVGRHYGLPMISWHDAVWPEIQARRMTWEQISPDEVHPNDFGHRQVACYVTAFLDKVLKVLPADAQLPAVAPVPQPLLTDLYEHTALAEAADLKPVTNQGWTFDATNKFWKSTQPGSVIEFQISGRQVYFMFFRVKRAMGKAAVQLDDALPKVCDAWFDQTWGGYRVTELLGTNLPPTLHRVHVKLLEEKNPKSDGHEFRILGLGAAGAVP